MTNETISSGAESGFGGAAPGTEFPITFSCEGVTLLGILHKPTKRAQTGLVMVVGGPQYRVGGHRKFVNIARDLAAEGTAVLRFDCRGMGDSEGDFPGFELLDSDIVAAISALTSALPSVERIILWGLCDGASAICLCAHKLRRIGGVILINPWVRSETSAARAYLKHYYASHLFDRSLWRKIWRGEFDTLASIRSFARMLAQVISGKARGYGGQALSLPERMALGLKKFGGPIFLILSGRDLTAQEFRDTARTSRTWQSILQGKKLTLREIHEADHTFSRRAWSDQAQAWTREWLRAF